MYTRTIHYSRGKIGQLVAQGQHVIVHYNRKYGMSRCVESRLFWPYKPAWTGPVAAVRYRQRYVTTEYATAVLAASVIDVHQMYTVLTQTRLLIVSYL